MSPPRLPGGSSPKVLDQLPSNWNSNYDERLVPAVAPFNLRDVLRLLRRYIWLLLLATAATTGVAAYLVYTEPPLYRAKATIRITDARRELTGRLSDESAPVAGQGNADPVLTQIQILTSRAIAGEVVDGTEAAYFRLRPSGIPSSLLRNTAVAPSVPADTLQLRFDATHVTVSGRGRQQRVSYGTPVNAEGVRFAVVRRPDAEAASLIVESREKASERLLANLSGYPREHTNIIDVEYVAHDPAVARDVVNAVVRVLKDYSARSARDQSRRRREFIEEQLRQNDSALAVAQQELGAFRNRAQSYSSREKFTATQEGLAALATKREELDADRRMYRVLLSNVEDATGRAVDDRLGALVAAPGITNNPVISQLFSQLVRFQSARDSLTTGPWASAATHPDVVRLDTLIAAARAKLLAAAQSYLASLDARISALDQIANARTAAALRELPGTEAREGLLLQRTENMRRLSDELSEEYQKARMAEAVEAGHVDIVDLATLPPRMVGVGRPRKLGAGVLFGLFLGTGIAYLIEHLNTSIRRRSEMENLLQVPGLAVIPRMNGRPVKGVRPSRLVGALRSSAASGPVTDGLITAADFESSSAEAYRTLRTNLLFSQAEQRLKTIVVTSTAPGDGKTTIAANLAVTFGQQGRRVLLIDCDLRRARVHELFGVPRTPGLTELLMELEHKPVSEAVIPTSTDGLFLLPAGRLPPNLSELLGGTRMRALVEAVSKEYDLVVLDSPPVLAATDAAVLGTMVDGVLMVVRAGQTDRHEARDALRQLATVGARVIGAVLNDPNASVPQYAEFYYEYAAKSVT